MFCLVGGWFFLDQFRILVGGPIFIRTVIARVAWQHGSALVATVRPGQLWDFSNIVKLCLALSWAKNRMKLTVSCFHQPPMACAGEHLWVAVQFQCYGRSQGACTYKIGALETIFCFLLNFFHLRIFCARFCFGFSAHPSKFCSHVRLTGPALVSNHVQHDPNTMIAQKKDTVTDPLTCLGQIEIYWHTPR